jgi:UDP-2-acetamido-2,6-beta-L-arabino-hexul-4-ose reductase
LKRIVITGSAGLLGRHAAVRFFAANRAAAFNGLEKPFDLRCLNRSAFCSDVDLRKALLEADIVLHFAGVNRGDPEIIKSENPAIAKRLVEACRAVGARPHVVYANSIHSGSSTPYGYGKAKAEEELLKLGGQFSNLILPHVFGEGARAYYNNVTATLIAQIVRGETPTINPSGEVNLLHAGRVADICIEMANSGAGGRVAPDGVPMSVVALHETLSRLHSVYSNDVFPRLADNFELAMFNTYRSATYPDGWPRSIKVHSDPRGVLFEAIKGGCDSQTFLSTTLPGVTRGNHFHLRKVERFLVLQGMAIIRMRQVLGSVVHEYCVSGDAPTPVDIPTMFTHSIENVGSESLLTLFWTNEQFDPKNPDTFSDRVIE